MPADQSSPSSDPFYAPLREPTFALVWSAIVTSLTATWMHEVGSAWFMRELSDGDPLMVSLVQAAMFLPIMLLSVPMGTLGDMVDRRRFLVLAHAWLILVLGVVWVLSIRGDMTTGLLIALTVALGIGKAMTLPGFAALIPSLVSARNLPLGVGLYGMAHNGARVVGPALAGAMLAAVGITTTFGTSLLLLIVALALLLAWRREAASARPRARGYLAELRTGLSFGARDPAYRLIVARVIVFFLCAASLHALLPLLVDNAAVFGLAWGLYGAGALAGAALFPMFSRRLQPRQQLSAGILAHAAILAGVAVLDAVTLRLALLLLLGVAWFQVMSSAQLAVQRALPDRLRARGMGLFTSVVMAGFGLGAPIWGLLARSTSPEVGVMSAAALSVVALGLTHHLGMPAQSAGAPPGGPA